MTEGVLRAKKKLKSCLFEVFLGPVRPLPLSTRGTIVFFKARNSKKSSFLGQKSSVSSVLRIRKNQEFQGHKKGFEGQKRS